MRPNDGPPVFVDSASQTMTRCLAIKIMSHIVFARPYQLHRPVYLLRDLRCFRRKIRHVTAAESASHESCVYKHFFGFEPHDPRDRGLHPVGTLRWRPNFALAFPAMDRDVHWFHGR